jgi:hypothetical protein
MSDGEVLNREFLAERDNRMFKMKQAGVSTAEIARRFGVSPRAAAAAIQRILQSMNQEALLAYPEVIRMELERLDALQAAIWPMTQHRRVTLDDGTVVDVEPDTKAISQVLAIIDRRCRIMGIDQNQIDINVNVGAAPATPVLAGADSGPIAINAYDPETEARQLIELMGSSGVLDEETVNQLLNQPKALEQTQEIEDAEIIE